VNLELTLLALIWLELGKWRLWVGRALSLPFPIHRAFMRTLRLNIVEHSESAVCNGKKSKKEEDGARAADCFQVNKQSRLGFKVLR
jgi:hypothetical protein